MDLGDVRSSTATAHIHGRGSLTSTAEPDAMPYLGAALPVGIVGAAAVAVFMLVLDSLAGRPLATPSALGATILFGSRHRQIALVKMPLLAEGYVPPS